MRKDTRFAGKSGLYDTSRSVTVRDPVGCCTCISTSPMPRIVTLPPPHKTEWCSVRRFLNRDWSLQTCVEDPESSIKLLFSSQLYGFRSANAWFRPVG